MANIFFSFFDGTEDLKNPNAMSCHYESLLNGFAGFGNNILYYQHKYWGKDFGKAPVSFLNTIKKFKPDLIILFDNRCYYDLYKTFNCPIIIWEADSYLYFSNQEKIKENPDRYIYIVGQTVLVKEIKKFFNIKKYNQVHYLPSVTSVVAENIKQNIEISFIGTKFHCNDIVGNFMKKNPNNIEIKQYKKLINYIEQFPFSNDQKLLTKFNIKSDKIKNDFSIRSIVDMLSTKNRIQILSAVADLGLNLYGQTSWIDNLSHEPNLVLSYQNNKIYTLKQNQDIYNSSKISININHAQAQTGFSWRVSDIMASNACLVTQYKKDIKYLFPKLNIPMFNNRYEAYEICKKLLKNNSLRREIVLSSQEIINKNYRYINLLKNLQNIIGISLISSQNAKITRLTTNNKKNIHKLKINNFRLETRKDLIKYSTQLIINQVPFINKLFISRDTILDKITKTINNDKTND